MIRHRRKPPGPGTVKQAAVLSVAGYACWFIAGDPGPLTAGSCRYRAGSWPCCPSGRPVRILDGGIQAIKSMKSAKKFFLYLLRLMKGESLCQTMKCDKQDFLHKTTSVVKWGAVKYLNCKICNKSFQGNMKFKRQTIYLIESTASKSLEFDDDGARTSSKKEWFALGLLLQKTLNGKMCENKFMVL